MKHVLSIADFTGDEIRAAINGAEQWFETYRTRRRAAAREEKVTFFFAETSLRTIGSYREAARLLHLQHEKYEGPDAASLSKGEALSASAKMLGTQNASIIVMRTKIEGTQRWYAELLERYGYDVAVHNGGDGTNQHPTQGLLDALAIKQKRGQIGGMRFGFVGGLSNSRVVHSTIQVLRHFPDIEFVLVADPAYQLQPWYTEGLNVTVSDSMEALIGCDIVYAVRTQTERIKNEAEAKRVRGLYRIDAAVLERLGPNVLIMHPQPVADREVDPAIWQDRRVIMDFQASCGIPTRMHLLEASLHELNRSTVPATTTPHEVETGRRPIADVLRDKHGQGQYFLPIEQGTVIDHLPVEVGGTIEALLERSRTAGEGVVVAVKKLRSSKVPGGRKTTVVMEDQFLTDEEKATVAFLAGRPTFNEFRDGIARKSVVYDADDLRGIGVCPNESCITRNDVEAMLYAVFHAVPDTNFAFCHFCEQRFDKNALFAH